MTHVVTCRTGGCENAGIGIEVAGNAGRVICGPCETESTDIEPPLPDEPYEQTPPLE